MTTFIATHCDFRYASRALALATSICEDHNSPTVMIFAHDDESRRLIEQTGLSNVVVIDVAHVISAYPELRDAKQRKAHSDFFFAFTPYALKYAFEHLQSNQVWYVDADVFFLGHFSRLIPYTEGKDIVVSAHHFPNELKSMEIFGLYNVGILFFSGSDNSIEVLNWWAQRCLESTETIDPRKVYGDQKYLDEFPERSKNFGIFPDNGIHRAPWNLSSVVNHDRYLGLEDGTELLSYHFSGIQRSKHLIILGITTYNLKAPRATKRLLYKPYLRELNRIEVDWEIVAAREGIRISLMQFLRVLIKRDFLLKRTL